MNIFLLGFMGCGKSTIGKILAHRLGYRFKDLDNLIEINQKSTITEIFRHLGEETFRQLETETLSQLKGIGNHIIATGGGILTRQPNFDLMKEIGISIYLQNNIEELYQRIKFSPNRPLLNQANPYETMLELFQKREKQYLAADYILDVSSLNKQAIVSLIIRTL